MFHLKPTSKVVNHPDTLSLPDGINLLGDGHFQFSNGLRMILIHVARDKKKSGVLAVIHVARDKKNLVS